MKVDDIIKNCYKFIDLELAKQFIKGTKKPTCIIKGNNGYYWITTIGYAQVLINNGFELVK